MLLASVVDTSPAGSHTAGDKRSHGMGTRWRCWYLRNSTGNIWMIWMCTMDWDKLHALLALPISPIPRPNTSSWVFSRSCAPREMKNTGGVCCCELNASWVPGNLETRADKRPYVLPPWVSFACTWCSCHVHGESKHSPAWFSSFTEAP